VHRSAVAGQDVQARPPLPHAEADVVVVQVLPLQQPVAQVDESQTQLPLLHR